MGIRNKLLALLLFISLAPLLVFNITFPVKDEAGTIRGHITLVVPVNPLLHKSPHLDIFADNPATLLVNPENAPGRIVGAVNVFRGTEKKADDMTVAVIRTG